MWEAEAETLFHAFHELCTQDEPDIPEGVDDETMEKLMVMSGVRQFPVRVKCATLAWHAATIGVIGGIAFMALMWLFGPAQGLPEGSYAAQGNRGQFVMVIPSKKLVIVRRGEDATSAGFDIAKFSAQVLEALE